MAKGRKQKLFYLYKDFRENSDKAHPLTMPQIVEKLVAYGVDSNRPFELAEMKILIDAVQSSKFISEKETKTLIRKLLFLVGKIDARLLERDAHVPGRIKNMSESVYHAVDVIFRAQELDHQLRFRSFRWDFTGEKRTPA